MLKSLFTGGSLLQRDVSFTSFYALSAGPSETSLLCCWYQNSGWSSRTLHTQMQFCFISSVWMNTFTFYVTAIFNNFKVKHFIIKFCLLCSAWLEDFKNIHNNLLKNLLMSEIENGCKMKQPWLDVCKNIARLNQVLIHCWWQNPSPYVLRGSFASSLVTNG